MFKQQINGSCICVFCNKLISVNQPTCPHCGRENPSLWGYSRSLRRLGSDLGFTTIVTWGCIALYLITLLNDFTHIGIANIQESDLLSPSTESLLQFGATGARPVFELGRWWTCLSSAWLHGGFFHIAFNLVAIRYFGSQVAVAFGSGRLVIIYTVAVVTCSLLTSLFGHFSEFLPPFLHGAEVAVGASGGALGLLGALVAYGQITGRLRIKYQALTYTVVTFLYGFVMPNVDNWGHFGGFLGGYLISWTSGLDPHRREELRHLFLAIICLVLMGLSILVSVIRAVPIS